MFYCSGYLAFGVGGMSRDCAVAGFTAMFCSGGNMLLILGHARLQICVERTKEKLEREK